MQYAQPEKQFKTAERQLDLGYSTTLSGEETSYHLRKSLSTASAVDVLYEYLEQKAK